VFLKFASHCGLSLNHIHFPVKLKNT